MAKNWSLTVYGDTDNQPFNSGDKIGNVHRMINYLRSCIAGTRMRSVTMVQSNDAVAAAGTLTIASGSGTVGGTINGTAVTVTWATSDTATAAALATAINAAAAIVSQHVTATSALGVVTLTSKDPGVSGNAVTLAASGTGVTASGARLTGGSVASTSNTFVYG